MKCIHPVKSLDATVIVPPSKSYTNRALIISALKKEPTLIYNCLCSEDIYNLIECFRELGVRITINKTVTNKIVTNKAVVNESETYRSVVNLSTINKAAIKVHTPNKFNPGRTLNIGASGTGMRFLSSLAATIPGKTTITGTKRLCERPVSPLLDALQELGVQSTSNNGCPPITLSGTLKGKAVSVDCKESSQYVSALLLLSPCVPGLIVHPKSPSSQSYLTITCNIMESFGVTVTLGAEGYSTKGKYIKNTYTVEGDASSATYLAAAAAITGGKVTIIGLNPHSVQGDMGFFDALQEMGCKVLRRKDWISVEGPRCLQSIDIDMNSMPDAVPTLAVVALHAQGTTQIRNVSHIRTKESDRLSVLTVELKKCNGHVIEHQDGLDIIGSPLKTSLKGAVIDPHDDHRIAMSCALLGLKNPGICIAHPECVKKSFPSFWKTLESMGVRVDDALN